MHLLHQYTVILCKMYYIHARINVGNWYMYIDCLPQILRKNIRWQCRVMALHDSIFAGDLGWKVSDKEYDLMMTLPARDLGAF